MIRINQKVQVWDEESHKCLGWGKVIRVGISAKDQEEIPLIELESGRRIWGNYCHYIEEKKAIEIGLNVFKAIHKK